MPRQRHAREEVPIRLHYLIQEGRVGLPPAEAIEIIRRKREMESLLRLLNRLYLRLLGEGRLAQAERVFHCYRGLGEPRFAELFGQFGFPDELRGPSGDEPWPELPAEAAGEA